MPKHARRLDGFNEAILSLYAKGLTTGEISAHPWPAHGCPRPAAPPRRPAAATRRRQLAHPHLVDRRGGPGAAVPGLMAQHLSQHVVRVITKRPAQHRQQRLRMHPQYRNIGPTPIRGGTSPGGRRCSRAENATTASATICCGV
ncbi:hypothetical protein ACFYL6_15740 [Micromonospora sp. NPDC007208]|uniref:hypothetical protein n=1 Tax=Micromonospora sp. NPDC007208 TaxID=3364236 RepID=UPI0036777763